MTNEWASKFATAIIEDCGHERVFDVSLESRDDLEMVASALERSGCKVAWHPIKNLITVHYFKVCESS